MVLSQDGQVMVIDLFLGAFKCFTIVIFAGLKSWINQKNLSRQLWTQGQRQIHLYSKHINTEGKSTSDMSQLMKFSIYRVSILLK